MSKYKLLLLSVMMCLVLILSGMSAQAQSINELKQRQTEISNQKNSIKETLNKANEEKNTLLQEVVEMDLALEDLSNELDSITDLLDTTTKDLEQAQIELQAAVELKEQQLEALVMRLRIMDESGSMVYMEVLFNSTSLVDFLNRYENIRSVAQYDKELFVRLQETEELIAQKVDEISTKKKETEILLNEQIVKKHALEDKISEKERRVYELTQDASSFEKQMSDLDAATNELSARIKQQEAINEKNAAESRMRTAEQQAAAAAASTQTFSGVLAWPLPGYSEISSPYGNRTNPISRRPEFHTGIDIPAKYGTSISASANGYVVYSQYNSGGFGYTVIVDHGEGITTQYSHCSKLLVSVGDYVTRGQSVALIGSTGYSTGNHIHFEVKINGNHVNPSNYVKP